MGIIPFKIPVLIVSDKLYQWPTTTHHLHTYSAHYEDVPANIILINQFPYTEYISNSCKQMLLVIIDILKRTCISFLLLPTFS